MSHQRGDIHAVSVRPLPDAHLALGGLMNFAQLVFLVRANLVFVKIRYKHLGYKASPFYTMVYPLFSVGT